MPMPKEAEGPASPAKRGRIFFLYVYIDIRFTSKPGKGRVLLNFFKGSSSNRQGGERIARMVFIEAKSVS